MASSRSYGFKQLSVNQLTTDKHIKEHPITKQSAYGDRLQQRDSKDIEAHIRAKKEHKGAERGFSYFHQG